MLEQEKAAADKANAEKSTPETQARKAKADKALADLQALEDAWANWCKARTPGLELLIVYVNGIELPLQPGARPAIHPEGITFTLARHPLVPENIKAWKAIFSTLKQTGEDDVTIGFGFKNAVVHVLAEPYHLKVFSRRDYLFFFGLGAMALWGMFMLMKRQWLRDTGYGPVVAPNSATVTWKSSRASDSTISLSRVQWLFWFTLITIGTIYVLSVTGEPEWPTADMLILLGVATGTAAAGLVVDNSSNETLKERYSTLLRQRVELFGAAALHDRNALGVAEQQRYDWLTAEMSEIEKSLAPAKSVTLMRDLISDRHGVSILRLQMVIWTLILGVTYIVTIGISLSAPVFDASLLALMGISTGGYVTAKLQEG